MRDITYCRDVPDDRSIHVHLMNKFNLSEYAQKMPIRSVPNDDFLFRYRIPMADQAAMMEQADQIVAEKGWWGFADMYSNSGTRDTYHGGFSVTYNPWRLDVPIYASSLGQSKHNIGKLFLSDAGTNLIKVLEENGWTEKFAKTMSEQGMEAGRKYLEERGYVDPNLDWSADPFSEKPAPTRNGYFDTYRFINKVPEMNTGAFAQFFSAFRVGICRSRCAWLRPGNPRRTKYSEEFMWHTDESLFINLRCNIPLKTTPNFYLEDKIAGKKHLEVGYGYSWNTTQLHRVGHYENIPSERVHLVIGTMPWFTYIPHEDAFAPNEYFGEIHPIDMLVQGLIIENIELA